MVEVVDELAALIAEQARVMKQGHIQWPEPGTVPLGTSDHMLRVIHSRPEIPDRSPTRRPERYGCRRHGTEHWRYVPSGGYCTRCRRGRGAKWRAMMKQMTEEGRRDAESRR